jgi:hypothetical protein
MKDEKGELMSEVFCVLFLVRITYGKNRGNIGHVRRVHLVLLLALAVPLVLALESG